MVSTDGISYDITLSDKLTTKYRSIRTTPVQTPAYWSKEMILTAGPQASRTDGESRKNSNVARSYLTIWGNAGLTPVTRRSCK